MNLQLVIIIFSSLILSEMSFADTYYSCSSDNEKLADIRIYGYSGQFSYAGPYTSARSVKIDDSFKSEVSDIRKEVYSADENVLVDVSRYSKTYRLAWSLNGSVEIGSINFNCLSFSSHSMEHIGYFDTGDDTHKGTPFIRAVIDEELQPLSEKDQREFQLARNQKHRSTCIVPRIEVQGPKNEVVLSELLTTGPMISLGAYTVEHLGEKSTYVFSKAITMGDLEDMRVFDIFYDFVGDPSFPRDTSAFFEANRCE